jgi:hypothetical protein
MVEYSHIPAVIASDLTRAGAAVAFFLGGKS